jgi:predicted 3-demethylubiquinone-9 3-methyltransferase (glyoxalase superfamily)
MILQKITPNLWFDRQAEEAANFYISIFRDSRIIKTTYYGKEGFEIHKMPEGSVLTVDFEIEGQRFIALNGGPLFKFNESISFLVKCKHQQEIDDYWEKLTEGGDPSAQQCGWLKDKFGVSWQIVPEQMDDFMTSDDRSERLMKAMFQMKKLDIQKLEDAYNGK